MAGGREDPTMQMVEGVPVLLLRALDGQTQITVAPRLGGLVMQLVVGGHQWLHRNEAISLRPRFEGSAHRAKVPRPYVELGDVGLGDQCLFTVSSDTVTPPEGGVLKLLDHGEAWPLQPPALEVTLDRRTLRTLWRGGGPTAEGPGFAFELERHALFEEDALVCRFRLTNSGASALPLFWSSHDMVPLDAETAFELPEGTEIDVFAARGVVFAPGPHLWPGLTLKTGKTVDFSRPSEARAALGRDFACKLFTHAPVGPLRLRQGVRGLELASEGTRAGVWINWGGDSPPDERYQMACVERCLGGATDRVSEGLRSGETRWLAPEESHVWELRYAPVT